MSRPNSLITDTLFLACTRPAMLIGVPMQAAVINGMVWMIVFVVTKYPPILVCWPTVHYGLLLIVSRDYNMFQILGLWFETKARALNARRWGGSSVDPLPTMRARSIDQVRIYV